MLLLLRIIVLCRNFQFPLAGSDWVEWLKKNWLIVVVFQFPLAGSASLITLSTVVSIVFQFPLAGSALYKYLLCYLIQTTIFQFPLAGSEGLGDILLTAWAEFLSIPSCGISSVVMGKFNVTMSKVITFNSLLRDQAPGIKLWYVLVGLVVFFQFPLAGSGDGCMDACMASI